MVIPADWVTGTESKARVRRLDFIVSEAAHRELEELSKKTGRPVTELFRYGIGLMKAVEDAQAKGQRLMLVDANGKAVSELVVPVSDRR